MEENETVKDIEDYKEIIITRKGAINLITSKEAQLIINPDYSTYYLKRGQDIFQKIGNVYEEPDEASKLASYLMGGFN